MKMFLTRIGFGSKAVITGDATQKGSCAREPSPGLDVALRVLRKVDEIRRSANSPAMTWYGIRWYKRSFRHMTHTKRNPAMTKRLLPRKEKHREQGEWKNENFLKNE